MISLMLLEIRIPNSEKEKNADLDHVDKNRWVPDRIRTTNDISYDVLGLRIHILKKKKGGSDPEEPKNWTLLLLGGGVRGEL